MKILTLALVLAACTDQSPPIKGTTSLAITVATPTDLGDATHRLGGGATTVTVDVQALDQLGKPDPTFNNSVGVYVHFLGTLSPYLDANPVATIVMNNGVATNQKLTLPPVFGPTTLWFDDHADPAATYATGVSPTFWFRDAFISDIQTPATEVGNDAFSVSPLVGKNIAVNSSRYGATGKLVVTSVFAQGYTVADVNCSGSPCTSMPYDFVEVFSFSAPADQNAQFISEGQLISGFAGGINEFDGLTEIGFPQTFVAPGPAQIDKTLEPPTQVIDSTWFGANKINFERYEASAIEIDGGVVCPLGANYVTYKQWSIDPSGVGDAAACGSKNLINIITAGVIDLDPGTLVGKKLPKVVGILRPVNIGSFNVWIIYPRSPADVTLN